MKASKKMKIILVFLVLFANILFAEWTIEATYPIPEGASGLAYDGSYLYCGIYGANGGRIYQIDPSDGSYSLLFTGPQGDAFGLTYDGSYLWTTDHPGSSSIPAVAMQLDMNGILISEFDLPTHYMSGIAYDDGDFWVAAYYNPDGYIYKIDSDGNVQNSFPAPDNQPWDLCIQHDNLWMADYWGDAIYKLESTDGSLLETHSSEHSDPAGIVFDGQYLWYCDNGEGYDRDWLYKIDLGGSGTPEISIPITTHNYGTITVGDSATWNATVENIGTADLEITGISFTGTGSNYVSCSLNFPQTIPTGNNLQMPLKYKPEESGELNCTAVISSNDPLHPEVDITLTGNAVNPGPDIYVPETSHNYSSVRVNAYTRWFMEIQNVGDETLIIGSIYCNDTHFIVDYDVNFPINISVLDTTQIGIWFNPEEDITYNGTMFILSNDTDESPFEVILEGTGDDSDYSIGEVIWSYQISTSYDNSPKAIAPISDISGDNKDDVVICSEDNYIRCFNGNSSTIADILWEKNIYSGNIYSQKGLIITEDLNSDDFDDLVVGTTGGDRSIIAISGKTGETIWKHDTHEYGGGGWVYQVNCNYDYNNDGVLDVLASAGDDASDTGPKRVYCLDGLTGLSIWECPLDGPGFSVIGIEDVNNDGVADVAAGASNESETIGQVYGIDGLTGNLIWTYTCDGSSVWAIEQIDDITDDDIDDLIVGDFYGNIHGLDATNGAEIWSNSIGTYVLITRFEAIGDVNGDNHPDILPAHTGNNALVIDGSNGEIIWSQYIGDNSLSVSKIADISDDEVNDVLVGSLNDKCYLFDGANGWEIWTTDLGTPIDAIASIPDIINDGSMEIVAGGRNGYLYCISCGETNDVIYGDVDLDGDVTAYDAALTLQFSAGIVNPDFQSEEAADVDDDGSITAYDAALILQYSAGIIDEFPVEGGRVSYNIPHNIEIKLSREENKLHISASELNDVISYQFDLEYEGEYQNYELENIAKDGEIVINDTETGLLKIAYMNKRPLTGSGDILTLEFAEIKDYSFSDFYFNTTRIDDINYPDDEPKFTKLIGNYPNPFNSSTTILFSINHKDTKNTKDTKLYIYNIKGQKIKQYSIFNGQSSIVWNAEGLSSGIYFYKMSAGDKKFIKKMVLMR